MDDFVSQLDNQYNWDDIFTDDPIPNSLDFSDTSPDSFSFSVEEIEQLLLNDDDDGGRTPPQDDLSIGFLSDFLLDSPPAFAGSPGEVIDYVSDANKNSSPSGSEEEKEKDSAADELKENNDSSDAEAVDPLAKKRKRQLRNRDAAVRSRERKKMYVRDLEMKSRYFEGECKRLGMLLQCILAENQALRLSLQSSKAFDASMTKQESAVLLLESLLLGSLLWFLGIMCLLILPSPLQPSLGGAAQLESGRQLNLTPKKEASKLFGPQVLQSFLLGKRCKGARSRMKPSLVSLKVLA